ncbi:G-protein coupled receptor 183-like [Anableps anableps]
MERYVLPLNSTSVPTQLLHNDTVYINASVKPFSVFDGCERYIEGILFDLTLQIINVVVGIPANILVIAILIHNRKEPSTSDMYLGCLAFMDAYFGCITPISFSNLYIWHSKEAWLAIKFSFGVKDTSGPLFLSCICLDRFVAVLFPIMFGQLKSIKYRLSLTVLVLCLTFAYSTAKMVGGVPNFEKVFTGEILAAFAWMVVCNGSILWVLKKSRGAGKDDMHPMKKKAFKMVLSILCIIVFNYLPLVALFPFEDHYTPDVFRCYVQPVGFAFLNISSTIQPLVYLSRLEKVPFLPEAFIKKFTSCMTTEKSPIRKCISHRLPARRRAEEQLTVSGGGITWLQVTAARTVPESPGGVPAPVLSGDEQEAPQAALTPSTTYTTGRSALRDADPPVQELTSCRLEVWR